MSKTSSSFWLGVQALLIYLIISSLMSQLSSCLTTQSLSSLTSLFVAIYCRLPLKVRCWRLYPTFFVQCPSTLIIHIHPFLQKKKKSRRPVESLDVACKTNPTVSPLLAVGFLGLVWGRCNSQRAWRHRILIGWDLHLAWSRQLTPQSRQKRTPR